MINTQYGNEIEITGYDPSTQLVRAVRKSDGKTRIYPQWSLKADFGFNEINNACVAAEQVRLNITMEV